MKKSAYIKLVEQSTKTEITLSEVKELLETYIGRLKKTGEQLDWDYASAAFPYTMEEREQDGIPYLLLTSTEEDLYRYLWLGISKEEDTGQTYIQVVIPENATHGDVGKANEFCRFLAKELKAELTMFNQRVMYFQPRK